MDSFTKVEVAYLTSGRRLARLATVGDDGVPHVTPVGWSFNPQLETIDVSGYELARTKKFRDVARSGTAAIVIDDLVSVEPWRPQGIEVRGRADAIGGPEPLIRIHPGRVRSWGLSAPGGDREG
jgi:pyridoxamine 5'-phosphate oxidase family protein